MNLFKFSLSFLAVGGATYALIRIKEAPPWLIAATLAMAAAALISALSDLPRAIDAIETARKKFGELRLPTYPDSGGPRRREPPPAPSSPASRYEDRRTPPEARRPPFTIPAPPRKCAALVMSNLGGWGASSGSGLTCRERLDRARATCGTHSTGRCRNYAAGPWVAGIHCANSTLYAIRRNSFAGSGPTETEAFARAYQHAADGGFLLLSCRKRVALSADEQLPRRYD